MRQTLILSLALLLIASCALTQKLWQPFYEEKIEKFLVSQDAQYVVFLGKKYHYVFNDNGIMKELLYSPARYFLLIDAEKTAMKLSKNNKITAYVTINSVTVDLAPAMLQQLLAMGFQYVSATTVSLKIKLDGTRYLAQKNLVYNAGFLNNSYTFKVYENSSFGAIVKAQKIALTPITLTADAMLLIGKTLLLPFRR